MTNMIGKPSIEPIRRGVEVLDESANRTITDIELHGITIALVKTMARYLVAQHDMRVATSPILPQSALSHNPGEEG